MMMVECTYDQFDDDYGFMTIKRGTLSKEGGLTERAGAEVFVRTGLAPVVGSPCKLTSLPLSSTTVRGRKIPATPLFHSGYCSDTGRSDVGQRTISV